MEKFTSPDLFEKGWRGKLRDPLKQVWTSLESDLWTPQVRMSPVGTGVNQALLNLSPCSVLHRLPRTTFQGAELPSLTQASTDEWL